MNVRWKVGSINRAIRIRFPEVIVISTRLQRRPPGAPRPYAAALAPVKDANVSLMLHGAPGAGVNLMTLTFAGRLQAGAISLGLLSRVPFRPTDRRRPFGLHAAFSRGRYTGQQG